MLVGVNDDKCYNCGRRNPGMWGFAPALRNLGGDLGFVPFVIGTCAVLYVITLAASGSEVRMSGLFSLFAPSNRILFLFGSSGAVPVFGAARWWTVLSAGWLHGGPLHIVFNMMWVRQLAPATADLYGPGRMVIIYTAAGIAGFALSSFAGAYLPDSPSCRAVASPSAPPRRSSGCSARSSTTAVGPAAARSAARRSATR